MSPDFVSSLRRRAVARMLMLCFALLFVLCVAVLTWAPKFSEANHWFPSTVPFIAFVGFVVSGLYLHNSRCPRCRNRFAVRSDGVYNSFTLRCLTCGLSQE